MPDPCRGCEFREVDFGGCRCQAALMTGDAAVTDPACSLSPHREKLTRFVDSIQDAEPKGEDAFRERPIGISFRRNPG
jgi:pyrroloquinoline quinone biosynthesis protein E